MKEWPLIENAKDVVPHTSSHICRLFIGFETMFQTIPLELLKGPYLNYVYTGRGLLKCRRSKGGWPIFSTSNLAMGLCDHLPRDEGGAVRSQFIPRW